MNPGLHPGDLLFEILQIAMQALQLLGRGHETPPAPAIAAAVMAHAVRAATTRAVVAPAKTMSITVATAAAVASSWHITHNTYLLWVGSVSLKDKNKGSLGEDAPPIFSRKISGPKTRPGSRRGSGSPWAPGS